MRSLHLRVIQLYVNCTFSLIEPAKVRYITDVLNTPRIFKRKKFESQNAGSTVYTRKRSAERWLTCPG